MKDTPNFALPYPEAKDFGNGALDMQAFAEAAEASIYALQQGQIAASKKLAMILRLSADVSITEIGTMAPWTTFAVNILSAGTFSVIYNNGFNLPGTTVPIPASGSYMFGAYGNIVASGTVNVSSFRRMYVAASVPNGPQFTNQKIYSYNQSFYEANLAGGMFSATMGVFDYQATPYNQPLPLWWGLAHANAASPLLMKAGSVFWICKISELGS